MPARSSFASLSIHHSILRRSKDVRFRFMDDEAVVLRQSKAEVLVMNPVAGRILELCDGQTSLAALIDTLLEELDVDQVTLERDVTAFATSLVEEGILEALIEEGGSEKGRSAP